MSISKMCKSCEVTPLLYVQDTTQYYNIDAIYDDGNVDLGSMDDKYSHDGFHFTCPYCGLRWDSVEDLKTKEGTPV